LNSKSSFCNSKTGDLLEASFTKLKTEIMKNLKLYGIAITTFFFSSAAIAQAPAEPAATEPAAPVAEEAAPAEEEKDGKFTFSGYFDTYYFGNLNKPASRNNLGASGIARGFDRRAGQFQLGMIMTRIGYTYKNVEFVGEVGWGPNVEYGSYGSAPYYPWGTEIAQTNVSSVMIKQAYINYKPSDKLTFTAGQFGTHIGYEMIDAPLNFFYSINNTFNAGIPFYHMGLKATYAFSDNVSLMGGVVNGTDNINDNNRGKSVIGQLWVSPAEGFNIYLNTIQGNEANARADGQDTTSYFGVLDLVMGYQVTERLNLTFWGMYGSLKGEFQGSSYTEKMLNWYGVNLYATYQITDAFALGVRAEHFDNKDGARGLLTHGVGTSANTYTLTGNISIADGKLTLKPEFRFDDFDEIKGPAGEEMPQQFMDEDGTFNKSSQATIGMAAVFKF
jgi:hypothetical protein